MVLPSFGYFDTVVGVVVIVGLLQRPNHNVGCFVFGVVVVVGL